MTFPAAANRIPEHAAPTVIPHIKMTTHGLCDVSTQTLLPLFTEV